MQVKEINVHKFRKPSESEKALAKDKMDKMQKEGEKLVKGMFEFIDAQGGWLDFSYRFFPSEPCRTVRITHGEIVDLPMILVKHLNNLWKKVRKMAPELDENGKPTRPEVIERISRCRFTPVNMM
jgi:hypothetical protein